MLLDKLPKAIPIGDFMPVPSLIAGHRFATARLFLPLEPLIQSIATDVKQLAHGLFTLTSLDCCDCLLSEVITVGAGHRHSSTLGYFYSSVLTWLSKAIAGILERNRKCDEKYDSSRLNPLT
jgi:hypothetical protein